jgi:hypothetical protein
LGWVALVPKMIAALAALSHLPVIQPSAFANIGRKRHNLGLRAIGEDDKRLPVKRVSAN